MATILLVTDNDRVIDMVHTALSEPDTTIIDQRDPGEAAAGAYAEGVDAVVVDMRVGSMGAIAVTHSIRDAAKGETAIPVTLLTDRDVDAFVARRAGATNWIRKSAAAIDLRRAVSPTGSRT